MAEAKKSAFAEAKKPEYEPDGRDVALAERVAALESDLAYAKTEAQAYRDSKEKAAGFESAGK